MKLHPESARMFEVDEQVEKAKNAAFRLLSGRAYTRREVISKLRDRGFQEKTIDETIQMLERIALIDDTDFARRFVQEKMRIRPMGRTRLRLELKRRGVEEEVAEQILDETLADVDPETVALDLLRSRLRRFQGIERPKALARMCGFLVRRGFSGSVARGAAKQVWTEIGMVKEEGWTQE